MTRAAIYRRVSSAKQAQEDRFSLDDQLQRCEERCREKGYEIVADLPEVNSGAYLAERSRLTELREMIRRRLVDVVIVTNFDRLSRDQIHQAVILNEMNESDVTLEPTEENFTDDANGRFVRSLAGYLAEVEREKIRHRTMRGVHQRVRQGLMLPGSVPLFGYNWSDEKSRYVINEQTAPIARRIWQEAATGKSLRRIAIDLTNAGIDTPRDTIRRQRGDPSDPPRGGPWRLATIRDMLMHPAYWGEHSAFRWDTTQSRKEEDPVTKMTRRVVDWKERPVGEIRTVMPDAAPALVSPELAQVVHERLALNKAAATRNSKHPEQFLLRGTFMRCGICGNIMTTQHKSRKDGSTPYYICRKARRGDPLVVNRCTSTAYLMAKKVDAEVWESVMAFISDPERVRQEMTPRISQEHRQSAIRAITLRIQELDGEETNLTRAIRTMGDKPGSERLVQALEMAAREKTKAEKELGSLQQEETNQQAALEKLQRLQTMMYGLMKAGEQFDYQKKRSVLFLLNVRVHCYPGSHGGSRHSSYTVAIGRHGEVMLPVVSPANCDHNLKSLLQHTAVAQTTFQGD